MPSPTLVFRKEEVFSWKRVGSHLISNKNAAYVSYVFLACSKLLAEIFRPGRMTDQLCREPRGRRRENKNGIYHEPDPASLFN